jgi:hypothetical protein
VRTKEGFDLRASTFETGTSLGALAVAENTGVALVGGNVTVAKPGFETPGRRVLENKSDNGVCRAVAISAADIESPDAPLKADADGTAEALPKML